LADAARPGPSAYEDLAAELFGQAGEGDVDFDEEGELAAYRPLARAWAAEHVDPDWSARGEHRQHYPGLHARLAADGILDAG
jgi:hypothetical protein